MLTTEAIRDYGKNLEVRVHAAHDLLFPECPTWESWSGWETGGDGKPVFLDGIGCREHHICFENA